jgi:hypothetical protein
VSEPQKVGEVLERIGGRGYISAWARRMQRNHRRNWRLNGLRPKGRGYDWARTLIAEKLLEYVTLHDIESEEAEAAASGAVEVRMAELAAAVGCNERIARREIARLEAHGCLKRIGERDSLGRLKSGRAGTMLHIYRDALTSRVLGRLHRFEGAKTATTAQLALPLKRTVDVPPDIQASIDRMAALAAARAAGDASKKAKTVDNSVHNFFDKNADPSPSHTLLQPSRNTPSALAVASGEGGLRRRETKFAKFVQRPDLKSLQNDWRGCEEADRIATETLSDALRKRLHRHLRLCCWYRGLGITETRRVLGAVGWTASSIGKASKRKYFLHDAIGWVMTQPADKLRDATASWNRMLGRARVGFAREPKSQVKI